MPPRQDLGDQGGVSGARPAVAIEQPRRGVKQEREKQPFRLGEIEGALQSAPGGARVTERVAGDRFEQPSLNLPEMGVQQGRGAAR